MKDLTVLITGGNKGIGLATTKKFIEGGFKVCVVARDFSSFDIDSDLVQTFEFDLSDVENIPELVSRLPHIDVLVNCAGVFFCQPYNEYSADQIQKVLKVNLEAPAALTSELAKGMEENGFGRVVNISSVAGQFGHPDIWYGATKAGLINITKGFAGLLGRKGITVNCVAPGPTETTMVNTIPADRQKMLKSRMYTDRFTEPEEVADTIYWLATDAPEHINGICIDINNGLFAR